MDKEKKLKTAIIIIAILVAGIFYFCNNFSEKTEEVVTEQFATPAKTDGDQKLSSVSDSKIYIHICGQVKKPGVYIFKDNPRVIEVVEKAGGFTKKADRGAVNQAESIADGTQLSIPEKSRKKDDKTIGSSSTKDSSGKVNINQADKEELMTLSGIGESKAAQIISYRETKGLFQKIEDIMNISGIKTGVFEKVKEFIVV